MFASGSVTCRIVEYIAVAGSYRAIVVGESPG